MKKRIVFLLVLLFSAQTAAAALPPNVQKMRDLNVMVNFIKEASQYGMAITIH